MISKIIDNVIPAVKRNYFLSLMFFLSIAFELTERQSAKQIISFVDWSTIFILTGLIILTTGIKESGFFSFSAYRISSKINNERILSVFLIFSSVVLSMFLTNDIALFIVVPLTLSLQQISVSDYTKLIIFEAIAVNTGSSLTPIGNPQNIFLWHQWGISFPNFIMAMAPLFLMQVIVLFIIAFFTFPNKEIKINRNGTTRGNRKLFFVSILLLILFVISAELHFEKYILFVVVLSFFFAYKQVIFKTDIKLIFLFILLFINVNFLSELKIIHNLIVQMNFKNQFTVLLSGSLFSQIISNVPAAILLSKYSTSFKMIAYGVSIGGNGLVIGSFANLIALNFIKNKQKYLLFHIYSFTYFLITLFLVLSFLI